MTGIDSKLDRLREQSKDLVSALSDGGRISFGGGTKGNGTDSRKSESKSRYVPWELPMRGAQKAQPSMWSETIPMDREFMDTGMWKPEMTRAQDEALMSVNESDAAGSVPIPRAKPPVFFAWSATSPVAADVPPDATWVRSGAGWQSTDGVFYSDKDLVKDILTDIQESQQGGTENGEEEEEEEESTSDNDDEDGDEEYVTENQLRFHWTKDKEDSKPSASFKRDDHRKGVFGFSEEKDGVSNWSTEYDTQCLLSLALRGDGDEAAGPIAGSCTDQFTRARDPSQFSWGRDKKNKKKTQSEEDEAPAPNVSDKAPYDTWAANEKWTSESSTSFNLEVLVVKPEPVVVHVNSSSSGSNSNSNEGEDAATASPKRQQSKRFQTENSLNFLWPVNSAPASSCMSKKPSQIHYSNEESAAAQPLRPSRCSEDDILSFGIPTIFVSEMNGRFLKFDGMLGGASRSTRHKNDSDPYLLAHHSQTLEQIVDEAFAEVEEEDCVDAAVVTEGEDSEEEEEEEEEEEIPAAEEDLAANATAAPSALAVEIEATAVTAASASVDAYSSAEPMPPSVTITPESPVPMKKGSKVLPSFTAKRGHIVNKNPSRSRKERAANAVASKESRASKAITKKNAKRDKNGGNPLLRNKRYPGSGTAAAWHTESTSQFQYRYVAPPKPFTQD